LLSIDNGRLSHTASDRYNHRAVSADARFELRQLRTFVAVAERRSFSRAGDELHVAQQAVSQQIKALERLLGVTLLQRTSRHVELTPEGAVFLAECRRVLAAAERAARRVAAAARGEAGTLRLAFTLTTVWDTIPQLLARLGELRQLRVQPREVFGADVARLLLDDQCDLAIAPMTSYPRGFHTETVRREPLCVAVGDQDRLARRQCIELATLHDRRFELWPRAMAPGFYDAVLGACHAAGFEPQIDEHATGNTVWGYLARSRGVALINASLSEQLPRGIVLVPLAPPGAVLTFDAVWRDPGLPVIERARTAARELAGELRWLTGAPGDAVPPALEPLALAPGARP
jgi:DNA-binding transcriptional LysR family regulator